MVNNQLLDLLYMRKRIAIFILTLLGISVSVDADAVFTSVGISNDKEYYLESGIFLLLFPVGFHYESTNKTLSLFSGFYYPKCLGRIKKHGYFCYAHVGFNIVFTFIQFHRSVPLPPQAAIQHCQHRLNKLS